MTSQRIYAATVCCMLLIFSGVVHAATRTAITNWGNWSNSSNWSGGTGPSGTGDDVYANTANFNTNVDATYTITGILFNKSTQLIMKSTGNLTINGNFTSNGALTITLESGSVLTVNGNIHAKNDMTIVNNGGTLIINGSVSSNSGDISITNNGTSIYVRDDIDGNNDVDIVSNSNGPTEIGGGVNAGNNASFTANDDLIIGGVVDVGNSAVFTGNGGGAAFELGGISAGNGTSLTFNGDATINGSVSLGQNTNMTVNSGTLTVTDDFTAGGGSTNYTVHSEMVVGGNLNLDNGNDTINGHGTVTTGGSCQYNTGGSATITQNCEVTREVALPVELIEFNGRSGNNSYVLDWSTASEKDNDYFTISRSFDGINFTEIAIIKGNGTTNEVSNYQYEDYLGRTNRELSTIFYELAQTDYDGTYEKLEVVAIGVSEISQLQLVPNLVDSQSEINVLGATSDLSYRIIDLDGSISTQGNFINSQKVKVPFLQKGQYFLQVYSESGRAKNLRFVVK